MITKAKGTSVRQKIMDLATKLDLPFQNIQTAFMIALVVHGNINSRSKDVHDLSVFLPKVDATTLGEALKKCFAFRETEMPESFSKTIKTINTTSLQRGWMTATTTVPKEREFKEVFDDVVKGIVQLEKFFK